MKVKLDKNSQVYDISLGSKRGEILNKYKGRPFGLIFTSLTEDVKEAVRTMSEEEIVKLKELN